VDGWGHFLAWQRGGLVSPDQRRQRGTQLV